VGCSTGEVRSRLVECLNLSARNLTRSIVGNHLMQLEAQTTLPGHIDAPAWLTDGPNPWPPLEVLACRNELVHLPSCLARISHQHVADFVRSPAVAGSCGQNSHEFCYTTLGPATWRRPATPAFFNTAALAFDFDPDAGEPAAWQRFLTDLWGDDQESRETLREWFGYSLTHDTSQQKILMLVGPPRSGKGTIARILSELVGRKNVAGPTLSSLGTNFGLWPLVGKSLAIVSDARLGGRSDRVAITERLLSISGEDALTVDRKNLEPVTCTLPARFVILTNELPRFTDSSGALASRMIVLRLTRSWLGKEDHRLTARLRCELPGILLWAIAGWRRLRERGYFEEPPASAGMRQQLDDLTSPIKVFIRERCQVGPEHRVVRGDLYHAYKKWCGEVGRNRVEDDAGFGRQLLAAVPAISSAQRRVNGEPKRFYDGIGLPVGEFQDV
ncbi:MAG TPA: phage/plasmid primase, P4 family, partial [Pirellulales bacterium]|nr:phage/plasmid primase, P4 family [Pirellulales bacterium]